MSESRAVERARHQLAIMLHEALMDQDVAPMNLAAKTGIGEKRISSILAGTARERGDITFAEMISMFEFLNHEVNFDAEPIAVIAANRALMARDLAMLTGQQPDMFSDPEDL